MRYHVLACDYDGTLARDGRVSEASSAALARLRASGRRLIMLTGRRLDDLLSIFSGIHLFDRVVAENGAVLYRPDTKEQVLLCERPPEEFTRVLRERGIGPLEIGRVIVSTNSPNETAVVEAIRDLGLELNVIFNKGAVMVLPSGINKATGLAAALSELGFSEHNVVGVGDAENDHAFLSVCECGVAVANALPMLKKRADMVMSLEDGAGMAELIDKLLADDLREAEPARHSLLLGRRQDGREVKMAAFGANLLVSGPSGSGKSTFATAFLERLQENGRQYCVIDSEGDYDELPGAAQVGDKSRIPSAEEALAFLQKTRQNVVINLLGIALEDRPAFFMSLFPRLLDLKARTGRPHWIVLDEAHHLFPSSLKAELSFNLRELKETMMITVHPGHVSPAALTAADILVAIGGSQAEVMEKFGQAVGAPVPALSRREAPGEALAWFRRSPEDAFWFRGVAPRMEHRRHLRKYAEGDLGLEKSFYFRGPKGALNLRAQNLMLFNQLAEGVDDETWLFHLRRHDFSRWFEESIKDQELAREVSGLEERSDISARQSRALVRSAVEKRYTAPV